MNIDRLIEAIGNVEDVWVDNYIKQESKKIKTPIWIKAAASFLAVMIVSGIILALNPALAQKFKNVFGGFLGKENKNIDLSNAPELKKDIEKNVLVDENEHLRFEVLEKLNDGMMILMTVRYTALDDTGKKWLDESFVINEFENGRTTCFLRKSNDVHSEDNLSIWLLPDEILGFVDTGFGEFKELYEYAGESERTFLVYVLISSPAHMDSQKILLKYPFMEDSKGMTVEEKTDENAFITYELSPADPEEKHKEVKMLRVSGLTFVVNSEDKAFPVDRADIPDSVELIINNDSKKYVCSTVGYKSLVEEQSSRDSKGTIFNGCFYQNGNLYSFEKEAVERIIIIWHDKTVSEYECRR